MKILLWHGYLLGGTGSNVYTRQLAREWSRAGHDVTVLCQEPHPERYDLGGAEVVQARRRAACCPSSSSTATRATTSKLLQDCTRDELDRWVEANAAAVRERLPADLVFCNHVLLGGAVGAASGAPYVAQGARLRARVLDARAAASSRRGGVDVLARRACGVRRLRAHPGGARGGLRPRRARARGPAGRGRRRRGGRSRATRRSRRCSPRRAAIRRTRATRTSGCPDEGNAERLAGVPRGRRADGRLLREAPLQQGRPRAARGARGIDARAVIVGFGDYRDELEALADPAEHALHRPARAPAPRPPARARGRLRRPVDLPGGVRDGRGGGGRRRLPAARRAPLRASPRSRRGSRRSTRPSSRELASFTTGDVDELREKLRALLALPAAEREAIRAAARRAAVERWSWSGVAERLLALRR